MHRSLKPDDVGSIPTGPTDNKICPDGVADSIGPSEGPGPGSSPGRSRARVYEERVKSADALEQHPALLRLAELETLRELAKNANARLYLGSTVMGWLSTSGSQAGWFVRQANRL